MALPRITSPHAKGPSRTQRVMLLVLAATLPGVIVLTWLYGAGTLINMAWACAAALGFEAAILKLRQRPVGFFLRDGSVLVTAVLLALALPPYSPWWLTLIATGCAVVFGKQLYGGLGQNPFNPAMIGYVVVLISFPVEMTTWPVPHSVGLSAGLQHILGIASLPDGWTQATALDVLKVNKSLTIDELWRNPAFGHFGGIGSEVANLAFLAGGLFLLHKRLFSWHAPVGMLGTLMLMSLLFWNGSGSDSNGSPLFHLLSGATMLGAFFIVTDPVSSATSPRGRLIFGAGVGVLVYVIRAWGGYPDGVAFGVLLMNLAAPTIDYYTRPRTYGHRKAERGFKLGE
ncbi:MULTISPECIES: RnfABCDGE type electron transport complex subunit D [Stutzerimonas stutzeri subgroup]|jgi:electron transport complex protein RnfD|uniref:Ion-translocating oxidoreductase complex subunit D n=1 Tax=Stutzerimonas stutzeri NF13 TaxID=1212548 RepID=M2VEA5_STUST|nr:MULTISPECIES: RnfABCDGE type electron transport complex subunit D [Stutzerimonas stutzeri subgroup]EMD98307.1 RnfABCDGE type electron transport complex subunit D [Stutzerimonas stutzeri NF13]MBK3880383.1 RnfABCDGE type electron transport complex subunit D [Stutzerimonas stutzeri]MCQ4292474.1 RnfABCDGE type electron transport complex subunit D [Stutzerimonas stutzeri]WOF80292.1 RnfABCDGE type electron transport complex subunit D [Pseudomonas sp. FeN3W]